MRRRPALTTVALATLAAAAVVGAVVVVGSPATSSAQERTVTVARGVIQSTVSGSGNLEPANEADVDFATSGEITHIYVKAGQHVVRDELLAKIDPDAANVALAQAEASLQSAQDALDQAETAASAPTATTAQPTRRRQRGRQLGSGSRLGRDEHHDRRRGAGQPRQRAAERHERREGRSPRPRCARPWRAPSRRSTASVGTTVGGGSSSSSSSSSERLERRHA